MDAAVISSGRFAIDSVWLVCFAAFGPDLSLHTCKIPINYLFEPFSRDPATTLDLPAVFQ